MNCHYQKCRRATFLIENCAQQGQIMASSEVPSLPVSNLLEVARHRVWRSDPADGHSVQLDITLPDNSAVGFLALLDFNGGAQATIQLQSWEDGIDGQTLVYDGNAEAMTPPHEVLGGFSYAIGSVFLLPLDANFSEKYWRVTLTDPAATYLQLANLYLGPGLAPFNHSYGWSESGDDAGDIVSESLGRQQYFGDAPDALTFNFSWDWLDDAMRKELALRLRHLGQRQPFFFAREPVLGVHPDSMYCRALNRSFGKRAFDTSSLGLTLKEAF